MKGIFIIKNEVAIEWIIKKEPCVCKTNKTGLVPQNKHELWRR